MSTRRDEFTDRQKAEIFVRDRALCCFSGRSLWHIDYGAGPAMLDCVDHIVPACKGGQATLENGTCTTWRHNKNKGHSEEAIHLFFAGLPTADFFFIYESISAHTISHLQRFAVLHPSDWYFNRSVIKVIFAADSTLQTRRDGTPYTRNSQYWCSAALKSLVQWHRLVDREGPRDLQSRGLLPIETSADHELLLCLLQPVTLKDLLELSAALSPYLEASSRATDDLAFVTTRSEALALMAKVDADPHVVPRVKRSLRHNVAALYASEVRKKRLRPMVSVG